MKALLFRLFSQRSRAIALVAMLTASIGLKADDGASRSRSFVPVVVADWTATGGVVTTAERDGVLIPAGAQLSRFFAVNELTLKIACRPYFTTVPEEWAMLYVGPASLTFVRNPDGGGVVLFGDEPLALPFGLVLDEDGRSRAPIDFTFHFDRNGRLATLTVRQASFDVPATAADGPIEVSLSAGSRQAWLLDELAVDEDAILEDRVAGAAGNGTPADFAPAALPGPNRTEALREARDSARELFGAGNDLAAEKALTAANRNPANSAEWHLETADALVQLAFGFSRSGRPEKAAHLATRALEHAERAARKAERPGQEMLLNAAQGTTALIREKLLADYAGARAFYLKVAARHPRGGAGEQLNRLERIHEEAGRKARGTAR